jgi:hypothetical protein
MVCNVCMRVCVCVCVCVSVCVLREGWRERARPCVRRASKCVWVWVWMCVDVYGVGLGRVSARILLANERISRTCFHRGEIKGLSLRFVDQGENLQANRWFVSLLSLDGFLFP